MTTTTSAICAAGSPLTTLGFTSSSFMFNTKTAVEAYLYCFLQSSSYAYVGLQDSGIDDPYIACGPSDVTGLNITSSSNCPSVSYTGMSSLKWGVETSFTSTTEYWAWNPIPTFNKITPPAASSSSPVCAVLPSSSSFTYTSAASSSDCIDYCASLDTLPTYYGLTQGFSEPYCYCLSDENTANLYAITDSTSECGSCSLNTFPNMTCGLSSTDAFAVYKLDRTAASVTGTTTGGFTGGFTETNDGTTSTSTSTNTNTTSTSSSKLSIGAIAGIAVAAVIVIVAAVAIVAFVFIRRRGDSQPAKTVAGGAPMLVYAPKPDDGPSGTSAVGTGEFSYPPDSDASQFSYGQASNAPYPPLPPTPSDAGRMSYLPANNVPIMMGGVSPYPGAQQYPTPVGYPTPNSQLSYHSSQGYPGASIHSGSPAVASDGSTLSAPPRGDSSARAAGYLQANVPPTQGLAPPGQAYADVNPTTTILPAYASVGVAGQPLGAPPQGQLFPGDVKRAQP
ncbi:hypothetical protein HK405_004469 [Cladochytrium tenue]|nr:hypothetical protein HK405_004469 [Cladochytrium tenue]